MVEKRTAVDGVGSYDPQAKSPTFIQLQQMASRPLFAKMGPLSRLMAHAVSQARDPLLVQAVVDQLDMFARTLCIQWRRNKLSEIDASEESVFLGEESLRNTIPLLWKVLKMALFGSVTVLRSTMERSLGDKQLASDQCKDIESINILSLPTADNISPRCAIDSKENPPYPTPPVFHLRTTGRQLFLGQSFRIARLDRHSFPLSRSRTCFSTGNPPFRPGTDPSPSAG